MRSLAFESRATYTPISSARK